jgi:hypothetical protein
MVGYAVARHGVRVIGGQLAVVSEKQLIDPRIFSIDQIP